MSEIDFTSLNILLEKESSLDAFSFVGNLKRVEDIDSFLNGYGVDTSSTIEMVELFGHFREAIEFIQKNFLKPQFRDGLDLKIPNEVLMITDVKDLYWLSREDVGPNEKLIHKLWSSALLKVMHTIVHINKDLRQNYFSYIQTQIFDRYYKHLERREEKLYLESNGDSIEIEKFETKSKKSRDSLVIKLLHKKESFAEELFDRIGVRIVTRNKFDCLNVINFLTKNHIVLPQNIKPSRSHNSLIDLAKFKEEYNRLLAEGEESCQKKLTELAATSLTKESIRKKNEHTLDNYRSMHISCRQLIKHINPLAKQLDRLKVHAIGDESELGKMMNKLDSSSLTKELKFFYSYELQITDIGSHLQNTRGESSHKVYKESQKMSAMNRLFKHIVELENKS